MIFNATAKVEPVPNKVDEATKLIMQAVKLMCDANPDMKDTLVEMLTEQSEEDVLAS